MKSRLDINLVFQEYPLFYQPYIKLVLDDLKHKDEIDLTIIAYKGILSDGVEVMPSYFYRKIIAKFHSFFNTHKPKLNYSEIKFLKNKVDVVHIQHSYLFPKILGLLQLPISDRPKIVITLRGGDTYIKPWIMEKWEAFYNTYGNMVDAFVTVSDHQKNYLTRWGIPEHNIHVIPISFGTWSDAHAKYPNKTSIKIISAFRMCWEKNIDANIRTVKALVDKGYTVDYHIYGDGHDLGQVFYLIHRYELEDSVSYKGKIDNAKFKDILSDYDFYLQLSLSEAAGATVIEAQSKGLPCIVSDSDGLPEMILDGKTGFAVPYYDIDTASEKIIDLYEHNEAYHAFSQGAIDFVNKKFTVEKVTELLVKLYTNLLK